MKSGSNHYNSGFFCGAMRKNPTLILSKFGAIATIEGLRSSGRKCGRKNTFEGPEIRAILSDSKTFLDALIGYRCRELHIFASVKIFASIRPNDLLNYANLISSERRRTDRKSGSLEEMKNDRLQPVASRQVLTKLNNQLVLDYSMYLGMSSMLYKFSHLFSWLKETLAEVVSITTIKYDALHQHLQTPCSGLSALGTRGVCLFVCLDIESL